MEEPSKLIIRGQKGYASTNPILNLIFLGRDFKEDEAELCITHETLHIVIHEQSGIYAYREFDKITILYEKMFGENIEGI